MKNFFVILTSALLKKLKQFVDQRFFLGIY